MAKDIGVACIHTGNEVKASLFEFMLDQATTAGFTVTELVNLAKASAKRTKSLHDKFNIKGW